MKLGVNIDHVATLREARYRSRRAVLKWAEPCLLDAARAVQEAGAHSITIHLREDRRHIQEADVWAIKRHIRLPLNLEIAANAEILKIVLQVQPGEVCLVPEHREEVTTEGGLDVLKGGRRLKKVIDTLQNKGIVVSLFIAPDSQQIREAAKIGAQFAELHTGAFAEARTLSKQTRELSRLKKGTELAISHGLRVNMGHGIRYTNVAWIREIPHVETLNIGHSIISRAIAVGLRESIHEMLQKMGNI